MDTILKDIIKGLRNTSSQDFFDHIVLHFASAIKADYVFIAKIDKESSSSSTIAIAAKGKIIDNFTYALKNTPCAEVAEDSICIYNEDIISYFPQDKLLIDMNIQSYIGSPLYDSKGSVLGITVALSEAPLADPEFATTIFEIFSGRIAVEMERVEQEKNLLAANKQLKKQLEELTQKDKKIKLFSESMQNSTNAILISDKNNKILQVNRAFEKVYGLRQEEAIHQNPNILSSKENTDLLYKEMWSDIEQKGYWKGEIINIGAQGKKIPFHVNITALYDASHEIESYLAIYTDLSKSKKAEALLRQQTKMATMGEMLSSITHQWKQPISAMKAILLGIEVKEALETIDQSFYKKEVKALGVQVDHMVNTMNDFKNFLSPDKVMKGFHLKDGLEDILTLFKEQYRVLNVSFDLTVKEDAYVFGFYNEYKQVIVNIINNAVDAYKEAHIQDKLILIRISTSNGSGCIEISDKAGGIKNEVIHSIFDPYITTKDSSKGTGIGLYMSKNIIENMDGTIEAYNSDAGASFTIKIPLHTS